MSPCQNGLISLGSLFVFPIEVVLVSCPKDVDSISENMGSRGLPFFCFPKVLPQRGRRRQGSPRLWYAWVQSHYYFGLQWAEGRSRST